MGCLSCCGPALADDPRDDLALTGARISIHRETGLLRFVGSVPGHAARLTMTPNSNTPEAYGLAFIEKYGSAFGINDPSTQLQILRWVPRPGGGASVRFGQMHRDVPVFAGELVINLDPDNALLSMNGEIAPSLTLAVTPTLTPDDARETVLLAVAKWYDIDPSALQASEPVLSIYDATLLKPSVLEPRLVWWFEVSSVQLASVRELVLVDAHTGAIDLHFNQIHLAKNRQTHDAGGGDILPGTLVCSEGDAFPDCAGGDTDVINAHDYAGDTYDFYATMHGRDGLDDAGGVMTSTVHWDDGIICPNAFWTGVQMVYCDDLADADDVVGHEMTHGVTDHESNLLYYYQSGAINESFSDVWGEFIDLTNGKGDDSGSVRWLLGEDLTAIGGAIRDMQFPGTFGDPDRMTSGNYWTSSADSGGVHINSGINNKATYLITDGDSFNGYAITGLGITKTAKIYYEAQTKLLTSGADYADLYDILYQACLNQVGTAGITDDDCDQVRNATDAVEMSLDPAGNPGFSPEAAFCPDGLETGTVLFADDMEASSNWFTSTLEGTANDWVFTTGYATSGVLSLYDPNIDSLTDAVAWHAPVSLTEDAYLHFRHGFGFEAGISQNYDGGVIEYSTNGSTWQDLDPLFETGQGYGGKISSAFSNPLAGRDAFVSESHGYVSSRYDLSSLTGEDFQVRFRLASDTSVAGPLGWVVDDVMIYSCQSPGNESCSGIDVLIQNLVFESDTICVAESSLTANTAVIVKSGATVSFQSPSTTLGPGFSVEKGGVFTVKASP